MKTIALNEFKELVKSTEWKHEQKDVQLATESSRIAWGKYVITSTLDGMTITCTGLFGLDTCIQDICERELIASKWKYEGFRLVYTLDEDSEWYDMELTPYAMQRHLPAEFSTPQPIAA